jgi:ubiquinone/menaquinone biosynthesis C-methylase UbiE
MDERITDLWDENAQVYADLIDGEGTPHHQQILNPCVESLMGDVRGLCIRFVMSDICNLDGILGEMFDRVLCNLVLLNIPCFDDALREFYRVLKPGGKLVFSVTHPAFNFYGPGSWEMGEKDRKTRRRKGLYFKMDRYFEEEPYERFWKSRNGEPFPQPMIFYHRTISTYVNMLLKAGFELSRLEEPAPMKKESFFERESRIPFFLVIRARKPTL